MNNYLLSVDPSIKNTGFTLWDIKWCHGGCGKEIYFNFQKNSWWNKKKSSTWPKIWFYLILGFIFFTNWNIMLQILHKVIFYNVGI